MTRAAQLRYPSEIAPPMMPLLKVTTHAATHHDIMFENIKKSIIRIKKRFRDVPGFKEIKGNNYPIILCGGGPSLIKPKYFNELKEMNDRGASIMACGSAHDYLISKGLKVTYGAVCDADFLAAGYLQTPQKDTTYLIASCCDDEVFNRLEGYDVYLWHCHSDQLNDKLLVVEPNYEGIGGGCTIGLRCISLAIMLGYTNIHFFGFDSSADDESKRSHAYDFVNDEAERKAMEYQNLYKINFGKAGPTSKTYTCAGYMLAQTVHFRDFYIAHQHVFNPTFHGEGLLPDYAKEMLSIMRKGN